MQAILISLVFAAVVAADGPPYQMQTLSPNWLNAGKQGCISASSNAAGAPVVIHDCNNEDLANHSWTLTVAARQDSGPQAVKVFGDKCLDVVDGANFDGAKVQIWDCVDGNTNQLWTYNSANELQWAGTNKCLDLTDGSVTDGTQLQLWTCSTTNANQVWDYHDVPNTQYSQTFSQTSSNFTNLCIAAESNTDGAPVILAPCDSLTETFPDANNTWVAPIVPLSGHISTFAGAKCLDVPNGNDANGTPLQVWSCVDGNTNQLWDHREVSQLTWTGRNKCVDTPNGNKTAGVRLQIWDCDPRNSNQWYF